MLESVMQNFAQAVAPVLGDITGNLNFIPASFKGCREWLEAAERTPLEKLSFTLYYLANQLSQDGAKVIKLSEVIAAFSEAGAAVLPDRRKLLEQFSPIVMNFFSGDFDYGPLNENARKQAVLLNLLSIEFIDNLQKTLSSSSPILQKIPMDFDLTESLEESKKLLFSVALSFWNQLEKNTKTDLISRPNVQQAVQKMQMTQEMLMTEAYKLQNKYLHASEMKSIKQLKENKYEIGEIIAKFELFFGTEYLNKRIVLPDENGLQNYSELSDRDAADLSDEQKQFVSEIRLQLDQCSVIKLYGKLREHFTKLEERISEQRLWTKPTSPESAENVARKAVTGEASAEEGACPDSAAVKGPAVDPNAAVGDNREKITVP